MSADLAQSFQIDPTELPPEAVIFGGTTGMRKNRRTIESLLHTDFPVFIQGKIDPGNEVIRKTFAPQGTFKRVFHEVTPKVSRTESSTGHPNPPTVTVK